MQSGFLLDIVIGQASSVFQLLTGEDESLLIRWNSFFILDLGLDVFNRIAGFDIECNSFSCKCFDEYLHNVTESIWTPFIVGDIKIKCKD